MVRLKNDQAAFGFFKDVVSHCRNDIIAKSSEECG